MGLSEEEKATLKALQEKEAQPDEDDFDIEIWDEQGAGARLPYSKGRTFLQRFGIDMPEAPPEEKKTKKGDQPAKSDSEDPRMTQRYFGSKRGA